MPEEMKKEAMETAKKAVEQCDNDKAIAT